MTATTSALKELRVKQQHDNQSLSKCQERLKLVSQALEEFKKGAEKDRAKVEELEIVNSNLSKRLEEVESENAKNFKALGALELESKVIQEDKSLLQKKLAKLAHLSSSAGVKSEHAEEMAAYKKMLTCTVCDVNQKETIIVSCNHMFCRECINKNIKARNRSCPSCKKRFGENDVHSIYF
eukprot:TRINITY_DN30304_c0_g1_i3.p1 TRINITY_DN30304_c0_g1~~TRINITY_DN30304_c0_g1_i3.p1  ORF type:complete len:181 (+),score=51.73 TRINITY_DN30304_c0_g1_i3:375-917(+)